MIILNFWTFKLSDIDQAYVKSSYKRNRNFQRFWKKSLSEKRKSQYHRIQDYVMHTKKFFRKMFACIQTSICGWKNNWGQIFKIEFRNGLNFFSNVFRKCMKILWHAFFPYTWCMDLYDKDFCCMELYDKHFRCMEVNPGCLFSAIYFAMNLHFKNSTCQINFFLKLPMSKIIFWGNIYFKFKLILYIKWKQIIS